MTPEQARRIVAASGLNTKKQPVKIDVTPSRSDLTSTTELCKMFGMYYSSVIANMSKLGINPIRLPKSTSYYWTNKDVCAFANRVGELRADLPPDVDWIKAKEAMEISKLSRATLYRRAKSVRRFVNGRIMCYFDRKEIENL